MAGPSGRRLAATSVLVAVVALALIAAPAVLARPSSQTELLPLAGQVGAHDPDLTLDDQGRPWLVYYTGTEGTTIGPPQILRSDDGGTTWTWAGAAWKADQTPAWVSAAVPGAKNVWAPTLAHHDGVWYLYYAVSTFGSNSSVIAVMTGKNPDPASPDYGWTDAGQVMVSRAGADQFNAIDPTIVQDADGVPWMFFGSFWSGIYAVQLSWPSGHVAPGAKPVHVATRDASPWAIEAASVLRHGGSYYLFVSWDTCCQGVNSTYNIRVGRASSVLGPYLDRDGVPMLSGGGTLWLASFGDMAGPGGESAAGDYLAFHYYDRARAGAPTLAIARLGWDDGWPASPALTASAPG